MSAVSLKKMSASLLKSTSASYQTDDRFATEQWKVGKCGGICMGGAEWGGKVVARCELVLCTAFGLLRGGFV